MATARRVIIASPVHDGRTDAEFTYAYGETIRACMQARIDCRSLLLPGEALVQKARNELIRDALGANVDDLIFIDSDQGWDPQWVLRLLKYPVDCVGGAVIKKTDAYEGYNVRSLRLDIPTDPVTGLMVVDGLGTGFLRLSHRAMRALWNDSEEYTDDSGRSCRMVFEVRIEGGRLVSEDISIAAKLKAAGIPIHLDPAITCSHIGRKKWTGNFSAWLTNLQAAEAKKRA